MDTIFSIIDELALTPEAKQAVSRSAFHKGMMAQFQSLPVPHVKSKPWKKVLRTTPAGKAYRLASQPVIGQADVNGSKPTLSGKVFISENEVKVWLDEDLAKQGVILCSLEDAWDQHSNILTTILEKGSSSKQDKLAAFTAGLSRHGFLFYVPQGVQAARPIEITINHSSLESVLPVTAVTRLDENAGASLVIKTIADPENETEGIVLFNHEISVGATTSLQVVEMQTTGKQDWTFNHENITLEKDANLDSLVFEKGGQINKRTFSADLSGEGSRAVVTGIYIPETGQNFIYDTYQNHLASSTFSDLLFNGVLHGDAYSLWKGNVYVAEGTKGADGLQVNKNLLLNEKAHAESIPGLEIIADEVRCTHAVTLSTVDAEQLFYLQSRGIEVEDAQEMIVSGFLEAAAMRINDKNLLEMVQKELK